MENRLKKSGMRDFGCNGNDAKTIQKEVGFKIQQMYLIGYSEKSKAYRLFDPVLKKMHVSRNVVFIEDRMYFSINENCGSVEICKLVEEPFTVNYGNLVRIILSGNSNHSEHDHDDDELQQNLSTYESADSNDELLGPTNMDDM